MLFFMIIVHNHLKIYKNLVLILNLELNFIVKVIQRDEEQLLP